MGDPKNLSDLKIIDLFVIPIPRSTTWTNCQQLFWKLAGISTSTPYSIIVSNDQLVLTPVVRQLRLPILSASSLGLYTKAISSSCLEADSSTTERQLEVTSLKLTSLNGHNFLRSTIIPWVWLGIRIGSWKSWNLCFLFYTIVSTSSWFRWMLFQHVCLPARFRQNCKPLISWNWDNMAQ